MWTSDRSASRRIFRRKILSRSVQLREHLKWQDSSGISKLKSEEARTWQTLNIRRNILSWRLAWMCFWTHYSPPVTEPERSAREVKDKRKLKRAKMRLKRALLIKKESVLSAKQFALRRALREEVSSKTLESRLVRPRARTRCRTENKRCIIKMPCFPLFSREKKSFE